MKNTAAGWLGVASALTLPGLAGCGGDSGTAQTPPAPAPHSVSAALPDGLTATLAEDRSTVAVGGMVIYSLMLANNTPQPISYHPVIGGAAPSGGVPAALIVRDAGGGTVFPVGAMNGVIFIGPNTTLAPGQSVSGTLAVGGNDEGRYSAVGQYSASAIFTVQTGTDSASQVTVTAGPLPVVAH